MKSRSFLLILISFFALNAFSQQKRGDVIFAGQPHSFSILKIETGDSVAFRLAHPDNWKTVKITGIAHDTILFSDGIVRIGDIKELKSSRNHYRISYLPSAGQLTVPPDNIYSSVRKTEDFKDRISNEMGFDGSFSSEKSGKYRKNRVNKMIFAEYLPTYELYMLHEKQKTVFSLEGDPLYYSGKVCYISSDTVFFDSLVCRFRQINSIKAGGNTPPMRHISKPGKIYPNIDYKKSDSALWKIILPPDSIYTNGFACRIYIHNLMNSVRKEKFKKEWDPLKYRNFIKFNLAKLLHLEIAFSYERVFQRNFGWETEAGYIIGLKHADASYQINYPVMNYNGIFIQTAPKYYFAHGMVYLCPTLLYKNMWFTGVRTGWPYDESGSNLMDQQRSDYGISLRVGLLRLHGHFVMDSYLGAGVKYVSVGIRNYGYYLYHDSSEFHWYHTDHSPEKDHQNKIQLIINLGIKIGGAF